MHDFKPFDTAVLVKAGLDDGSLGAFGMEAGLNGRLRNNHPYISAVAVLHWKPRASEWAREWIAKNRSRFQEPAAITTALLEAAMTDAPDGDDVFLNVIETTSEHATPLSRDIFDGPLGKRFAPDESKTAIIELPRRP